MNRTFDRIKLYTSWLGMKQEIEDYVRQCDICKKNKIAQRKTKLRLQITDTPEIVWQNCSMDIFGPLTQTCEGNRYLLTFQDELSKYTLAVPIPQQDASTVARVFVEKIILKFGIPQMLLTDQGSNFLTELFANSCKLLRVKRIKNSAYHPQTNGALERTHRVLVEYLRCYTLENQTGTKGSLMPPSCLIRHLIPVPAIRHTNYFSVERRICLGYYRKKLQGLDIIMRVMCKNYSPACNRATR